MSDNPTEEETKPNAEASTPPEGESTPATAEPTSPTDGDKGTSEEAKGQKEEKKPEPLLTFKIQVKVSDKGSIRRGLQSRGIAVKGGAERIIAFGVKRKAEESKQGILAEAQKLATYINDFSAHIEKAIPTDTKELGLGSAIDMVASYLDVEVPPEVVDMLNELAK